VSIAEPRLLHWCPRATRACRKPVGSHPASAVGNCSFDSASFRLRETPAPEQVTRNKRWGIELIGPKGGNSVKLIDGAPAQEELVRRQLHGAAEWRRPTLWASFRTDSIGH